MTEYNKGCETIITKEMIQEDWFGKMIKEVLWKVFEEVRDKDYDIKVVMSQITVPPKQSENVCAKCQGRGWVWCGVMNEDVTECDCTEEEDVRPLPSNPISADMPHPFGLSVRSDLNTFAESEHLSLPRKVKDE